MEEALKIPDSSLNIGNKLLLVASNISHAFDYTLFENVDLSIHQRETIAILGVSGSGKSTLLHILSSLLKPNKGRVIFDKGYLYEQSDRDLLRIRREAFGIIFQSHYLFKGFSAMENLEVASIIANKKIDYALLERLKIEQNLGQNVSELSGGQQQRVSIARVLIKQPRIIFADEPTGNLDRETANEVMKVLIHYTKTNDGGLFLVTHDESIAAMCDTVYRLEEKRLNPVVL